MSVKNQLENDVYTDREGYIKYRDSDYENEMWKDIETVPEYEISNLGRVRNKKSKYILKTLRDKDGYLRLLLRTKGTKNINTIIIHRWVAKLFLEERIEDELIVNHINEIKQDNRSVNLEWATQSENTNHGTRNKRVSKALSEPIILASEEGVKFLFDSCSSLERVTGGKFTRKGSSQAKNRKGIHRGFKVLKYDGKNFDYDCSENDTNNELENSIKCLLSMADTRAMRPNAKPPSNEETRKPVMRINNATGEEIRYNSLLEAVEDGFTQSNIIAVIKGKRKSHKGCKWYYIH